MLISVVKKHFYVSGQKGAVAGGSEYLRVLSKVCEGQELCNSEPNELGTNEQLVNSMANSQCSDIQVLITPFHGIPWSGRGRWHAGAVGGMPAPPPVACQLLG
ncbi:jg26532 [Pararge aegeria aegeria]|uniref:Jg26532 protein n=1 Tax=Pararge aegeria aegeria TaxID=348720 RepID=A0A8S4RD13_9NEOP|nr:jg26532 [Pararge aegeria aegeria]